MSKFRKLLALMIALVMVLSLAACGSSEAPATSTEQTGTGETQTESTDSATPAESAQTQEADACWAFVELLLSEDFQTMYGESDYCTPVNVNAFVNTGHAAIDDYNSYVQEQLRWATPEDIQMMGLYELDYSCIDKFQDLIESCSQVASQDSAVVTIVREEMPAYFSGQKDIEDVISVMEDRVQTFLDERG